MYLTRLTLNNFRNYGFASLSPSQGPVVLLGANGAGKTNILEALSFLSPGRGLRRANLRDIPRQDGPASFAVAARFEDDTGLETTISTGMEDGGSERQVRLSGVRLKGAELENLLQVTWLTPQQDGLFLGPAGDRRRFFDRLALTFDPSHNSHVNGFEKAMRGRNRLLEDKAPPAYFRAVEQEMAHLAVIVAAGRLTMLRALQAELESLDDKAFPVPEVEIDGTLERALASETAINVEEAYQKALAEGRGRDMAAGRTLDGPHKTDFLTFHKGRGMAADQCSTGEQKALLINLALAHAGLVSRVRGETPTLLLLDEVAAHLDENRRSALFERLMRIKAQPWLTGTDAHLFADLPSHSFRVEEGRITAV